LIVLLLVGVLPGFLKRSLYRLLFGYRIAAGVRIGVALIDASEVDLAAGSSIGHLSAIISVGRLEVGTNARIGPLNIIRGGERVVLGGYSDVMRLNVLNAIPDHDCTTNPESVLEVGAGTVITSGHRIDFTDKVTLGKNVIIGGRSSSFWTHNRQETAPIQIGNFCYLASEIRVAPGASLADECILAIGAVLAGEVTEQRSLVAGVPAKVVRPLTDADLARIRRKTRGDMPDGFYEGS
jgi:carbonic anhydrase/acetyltransferase-like protein (isoleucine patch superfamily)